LIIESCPNFGKVVPEEFAAGSLPLLIAAGLGAVFCTEKVRLSAS
jgi:hypothetical protein